MVDTLGDTEFNHQENYVVGKVAAIFFQNPSNFYKVMLIKVADTNTSFEESEIVVTGSFGQIQEEESYRFVGKLVDHAKYGQQFQVDNYQQEKPTSGSGLIAYLSGSKFPGIGKKTAEDMVDLLGDNVIDIILDDPKRLEEVTSLTKSKREMILETLRLNYGMEQIVIGLNQYGFGSQLAMAIYQTYQEETLNVIQENPYQLTEDIEGIGFKKADAIAEQLGYAADSPKRIRAAITHELLSSCLETGDTYVDAEVLLRKAIRTLEMSRSFTIAPDLVAQEIIAAVSEGKMQQEGTHLYENTLFFSEWGVGTVIQRLLSRKKTIKYNDDDVTSNLEMIEKNFGISYGDSQIKAIKEAIKSPLFILTGGPGTGKTTVINGIVNLFAELNGLSLDIDDYTNDIFPILLAAPTGRAAKRMNETTGLPASTIHRLLGLNGREKNASLSAKELEGGLLIVDEMSMVDTWLANTLLKAIPTNMQVIFVGDKDQLPSVGPGQVLHDLLAIEDIPSCELIDIYRQENESSIIPLAHDIKDGRLPADFAQNKSDRSFIRASAYQIEEVIRQVVTKARAKGFTPTDIQVLAPMYRGVAGIDNINNMMQEIFNPNETGQRKEVKWNDKVFRIGDKVLHLVNSPESNVFNGDMGKIVGITLAKESDDKVDELTIEFDSNEVTYKRNEWNKITLSYCCSIHKSQGSEFKMVILPMVKQYQRMLQRNLFYTGLTRSKDLLILIGEPEAFERCVQNEGDNRQTTLQERIISAGDMSLTVRTQLEAYESGLLAEATEDIDGGLGSYDPIPKEKLKELKAKEVKSENEVVTRDEKEVKEVSLFDEVIEDKAIISEPTEPVSLEPKVEVSIQAGNVDPMIGMENVTPYDFM